MAANSNVYTANATTLVTNFNVTPYYDDFDVYKNYYRLLFKPGYAVQARELTQLQTTLQDQINRFGKHVFREGSKVLGEKHFIEPDIVYLKIKDVDNLGVEVDVTLFEGQELTGPNPKLKAQVVKVADGTEASGNTKTLFIRYTSVDAANGASSFSGGQTITSNVGNIVSVDSSPTGYASLFTVPECVIFAKDHFISANKQTVILNRYSNSPTCQVGYNIIEEIVQSSSDTSLLDPAQEASNYAAPGADRLKLSPILTRLEYDEIGGPPNYVKLFSILDGIVQEENVASLYNILLDNIAKRTADESGDYAVNGLGVRIRENLNNGVNGGYANVSQGGNATKLSIGIEPGTAYVQGYPTSTLVTKWLTTDKGITYGNVNNQFITARYGNYVVLNEFVGSWGLNTGQVVYLYDTAQKRISQQKWSSATQTGSRIGSAKIKSVEYNSGVLGTANANVSVYLFDVKMNGTNSFANVRSLYYDNGSAADMGGDIFLYDSTGATLYETGGGLLFPVGTRFTRTLRGNTGTSDTNFTFSRTVAASLVTAGTITLSGSPSLTAANEKFPYGVGVLAAAEKKQFMLNVDVAAGFNVAMSGLVTTVIGSNTVIGTGTNFDRLNVGDKVSFPNNITGLVNTYFVTSIANSVSMNVSETFAKAAIANGIQKAYKVGDVIDLSTKGVTTGLERTVTVGSGSSSVVINLQETPSTTQAFTVKHRVSKSGQQEIAKTLRANVFVMINVAAYGTTVGPYSLGVSDLYRVQWIRRHTSAFSSETQGSDVTGNFIIDNGQRDEIYDLASITPSGITLSNTSHLLAKIDFFEPDFTSGVGYFSVDSYPINDTTRSNTTINTAEIPRFKSPTSGALYDLREFLDFRPVLQKTANLAYTVADASINPANTTLTFKTETNGLRIPAPYTQIDFDYSFYLPRKDLVVLDRTGVFSIINGVPAITPQTPTIPSNAMALATIDIAPYPSLAPLYANYLNRRDYICKQTKTSFDRYTMRDIGVLKNRIENLEYYTTLNALEKSALDFRVVDADGLDRFKNGVFVDTFSDFSLGATENPDFRVSVDSQEKTIRPIYSMESFNYDYVTGTNIKRHGDDKNIITLDYTESMLLEQNTATTIRNIEASIYRFIGTISLYPDTDNWVDTEQATDDNHVTIDATANMTGQVISQSYGSWETFVAGYKIYDNDTNELLKEYAPGEVTYQQLLDYTNWYLAPGLPGYESAAKSLANQGLMGYAIALTTDWYNPKGGARNIRIEGGVSKTRDVSTTLAGVQETTESLGNSVINTSLRTYIRRSQVYIEAVGLLAGARYYVFFDGENVTDICYPMAPALFNSVSTSNTSAEITKCATGVTRGSTPGVIVQPADIYADNNGTVKCVLFIPEGRFRVGTKEVIVTNSPTNEDFAVARAKAYYMAQGLYQQKQESILTIRTIVPQKTDSDEVVTNKNYLKKYEVPGLSCMAYSFFVNVEQDVEGVFLSSVDVFLEAVHPTLGIIFEIREMDGAGGITRNQVPFSEVYVSSATASQYLSEDASVPMNVKFKMPIFLYNNTQYAFVIHTEGINPVTTFWVSKLGDEDTITGNKVQSRALTGTLYTTNNNLNYDVVPDLDLKVRFNRAVFTTSTATVTMANRPVEFLKLGNVSAQFTQYGEPLEGYDRITLTGNTSAVLNSNILVGATSTIIANVKNIVGGTLYYMSNTGFISGETVSVFQSNGDSKAVTSTVTSVSRGTGILSYYRESLAGKPATLQQSNGNFVINDTLTGVISGQTGTIDSFDRYTYTTQYFNPNYISFRVTNTGFQVKSIANTGNVQSGFVTLLPNKNKIYDTEQALLSRRDEIDVLGSNSNIVQVTMSTGSNYVSPVLDLTRSSSTYVKNWVNDDYTGEMGNRGGNLMNKYISRTITLAEGQDAEDLTAIISGYRPPSTDIKVWAKICHAEDFESFDSKPWVEMVNVDQDKYSSIVDTNNFNEYKFALPLAPYDRLNIKDIDMGSNATITTGDSFRGQTSGNTGNVIAINGSVYGMSSTGFRTSEQLFVYDSANTYKGTANVVSIGKTAALTGNNGVVEYTTDLGAPFTSSSVAYPGFKQFAIKVGLVTSDAARVPRVGDLRAIALQR